jgi:hypothetical protein
MVAILRIWCAGSWKKKTALFFGAIVFAVFLSYITCAILGKLFPREIPIFNPNTYGLMALLSILFAVSIVFYNAEDDLSILRKQAAWSFLTVLGKTVIPFLVVGTFTSLLMTTNPFSLPSLLFWNGYLLLLFFLLIVLEWLASRKYAKKCSL